MKLDLNQSIEIDISDKEFSQNLTTVILKPGEIFSSENPNIKYIVKYNFDLENQEIIIPENCIICIDGGSLSNGTLVGNNTKLFNINSQSGILTNITLSGTWHFYQNREIIILDSENEDQAINNYINDAIYIVTE